MRKSRHYVPQETDRAAEVRRLLQPFVDFYGYELDGLLGLVKTAFAPARKGRGRRVDPLADAQMALHLEDEARRREEGSQTPIHDIYKIVFEEEQQSPQHYKQWRREYLRQKARHKSAPGSGT
jgi:hypothetical protein